MKVKELFEALDRDTLKYYAKVENPDNVPSFSWTVAEQQYRVGDVIFDNEKGLGATGNNRNILYMGMVALMKIDDFLSIAADHGGQREQSAADIKDAINEGYGIASPWLEIDLNDFHDKKIAQCYGHEGRARMICCKKYFGLTEVPVQIFFPGNRNRHITDEVIEWLKNGIKKEKGSLVIKDPFIKVFK